MITFFFYKSCCADVHRLEPLVCIFRCAGERNADTQGAGQPTQLRLAIGVRGSLLRCSVCRRAVLPVLLVRLERQRLDVSFTARNHVRLGAHSAPVQGYGRFEFH